MDKAARTRQRTVALSLPIAAVLYIGGEAVSPKGTERRPLQPASVPA
jgi:hypothetical protein